MPPPTLLLGTLYGHELYGSLAGVELHGRAPSTTAAVPTRILSSCGAPAPAPSATSATCATSADEVAPRRNLPCEIARSPDELGCTSLNLVWEWFLLEVAGAMPPAALWATIQEPIAPSARRRIRAARAALRRA